MRYSLKQLQEWKREYDIGVDASVEDLTEFIDKWECLAVEQNDKLHRRNLLVDNLRRDNKMMRSVILELRTNLRIAETSPQFSEEVFNWLQDNR
jgi:hypothetical protein